MKFYFVKSESKIISAYEFARLSEDAAFDPTAVIECSFSADALQGAYMLQEHIYDRQDIDDILNDYDSYPEDFKDCYEIPFDQITENDREAMAYRKRRLMDKYNMDWADARDDAIDQIIKEKNISGK